MKDILEEVVAIDELLDAAAKAGGKHKGSLESQAKNRVKLLAIEAQARLLGKPDVSGKIQQQGALLTVDNGTDRLQIRVTELLATCHDANQVIQHRLDL